MMIVMMIIMMIISTCRGKSSQYSPSHPLVHAAGQVHLPVAVVCDVGIEEASCSRSQVRIERGTSGYEPIHIAANSTDLLHPSAFIVWASSAYATVSLSSPERASEHRRMCVYVRVHMQLSVVENIHDEVLVFVTVLVL